MSGMEPCPFCGKEDLYFEQDEEGETNIVCDWCEYKTRIFQTIGDAARWWNTRPIEDDLRKRIAELEAVVDKLVWSVEGRVEFMYSKHQREFEDIVAEYKEREAESERFTVHSGIERQDDKSPNDTQTDAVVYGKESEE